MRVCVCGVANFGTYMAHTRVTRGTRAGTI